MELNLVVCCCCGWHGRRNTRGRTTASSTWRTTRFCATTPPCARCSRTLSSPTMVAHPSSRTTSMSKSCALRNLVSRMSSIVSRVSPTSSLAAHSCRYHRTCHKCLSACWTCPWMAYRRMVYR
ncbi:hypothetical protein D1007_34570 [Hordeum vulgare]|nr:hypothetical protein D1007_34570 [Hordeum vulgare]